MRLPQSQKLRDAYRSVQMELRQIFQQRLSALDVYGVSPK